MSQYNIYKDIAERTNGDIYVGVVGPVRTGKSTFIKRFMETLVLPNIKMQKDTDACGFLNEDGRCGIHSFRTGFCRLFPLARVYEEEGFYYIHQIKECKKEGKTKEKIKKWLAVANIKSYEQFVMDWHSYLKSLQEQAAKCQDEKQLKNMSLFLLQKFYLTPYDYNADFYQQFYERL